MSNDRISVEAGWEMCGCGSQVGHTTNRKKADPKYPGLWERLAGLLWVHKDSRYEGQGLGFLRDNRIYWKYEAIPTLETMSGSAVADVTTGALHQRKYS